MNQQFINTGEKVLREEEFIVLKGTTRTIKADYISTVATPLEEVCIRGHGERLIGR